MRRGRRRRTATARRGADDLGGDLALTAGGGAGHGRNVLQEIADGQRAAAFDRLAADLLHRAGGFGVHALKLGVFEFAFNETQEVTINHAAQHQDVITAFFSGRYKAMLSFSITGVEHH